VEPFNNSKVSSEIFYQCQPGPSLEGRMTSVCGEDGRWSPDPSQVGCIITSAGIWGIGWDSKYLMTLSDEGYVLAFLCFQEVGYLAHAIHNNAKKPS